ncbi:MAG: hydrogenase nickel incorporation protein HypB [Acidobacteriota bacterium]
MTEVIDVKRSILEANEAEAARLRAESTSRLVVNLISSPGSGKTTLLEATVRAMSSRFSIGVIEGDIATERDAMRLRALGVPAYQILTGGACHLDARQIRKAMQEARFPTNLDFLFIENVGNLICPTSYDLGEDFKVVVLSVTEGEDKPFKYPAIFSRASVCVLSKVDLLPHVSFDLDAVRGQVASLHPCGRLLLTSARTGEGIAEWCSMLEGALLQKRFVTR